MREDDEQPITEKEVEEMKRIKTAKAMAGSGTGETVYMEIGNTFSNENNAK